MELQSTPQASDMARRRSRSLIAAVGAAALVAVAVGVALSSHAQSRGVLASHMEQYSAKKSTSDMDSYFDNLPGGLPNHRKAHSHHAKHGKNHVKQEDPVEIAAASPSKHSSNAHLAHSKEAQKVGDDGLPVLPTKRMHSHSHAAGRNGKQNRDAFATDPSRTPGQKALNLPAPKLDLQAIHDKIAQQIKAKEGEVDKADAHADYALGQKALSAADKNLQKEHEINKLSLRSYKQQNPEFLKKMNKVHEEWLKKHDALPASKAEKQEYRELVRKEVGNISEIVNQGMTKFPPGMNAESFAAMTKKFLATHSPIMDVGKVPVTHSARG